MDILMAYSTAKLNFTLTATSDGVFYPVL